MILMLTTKKPKARFKIRIFDLKTKHEACFNVYEPSDCMTLEDFKKKLSTKSNVG